MIVTLLLPSIPDRDAHILRRIATSYRLTAMLSLPDRSGLTRCVVPASINLVGAFVDAATNRDAELTPATAHRLEREYAYVTRGDVLPPYPEAYPGEVQR